MRCIFFIFASFFFFHFRFNMLSLVSEVKFEPYVGYEARPGENVGQFSVVVTPPAKGYYAGGDKANLTVTYSGYTREDALFFALRNDCWPTDQYMPIFSARHSFVNSGTVNLEWIIPYNDLLQTKSLDTGGFMYELSKIQLTFFCSLILADSFNNLLLQV